MREVITKRPEPKDTADKGLCLITLPGTRIVRVQESTKTKGKHVTINSLSRRFESLLKRLGINGGRGFYVLRHVFETIGGESRDQVAVDALMGHADSSMAANYRQRISDDRLRAVTDVVRAWLFAKQV